MAVQRQVAMTLNDVQERLDASIMLIGHDMALLAQTSHRIAIMN
jgi:ABC-type dipeptide/oligopeptide/nickel transport system ATPase component